MTVHYDVVVSRVVDLIVLQACRGTRLDHGVEKSDGPAEETMDEVDAATVHRIPSEADFLMAYSVVPGKRWFSSARRSHQVILILALSLLYF